MPPVARLISLGILTTLIVGLGITFYHVLAPFLLPLFLAWIVAIVCRPLYLWCVRRTKNRPRLAAGLTTSAILLGVLLPLAIGTVIAATQLISTAQAALQDRADQQTEVDWRAALDRLTRHPYVMEVARRIEPYLANVPIESTNQTPAQDDPNAEIRMDPPPPSENAPIAEESLDRETAPPPLIPQPPALNPQAPEDIDPEVARQRLHRRIDASLRATLKYIGVRTIGIVGEVPGIALGLLGRIVSLLIAVVMFSIGLYYFLCDGPDLLAAAENLIPIERDHQRELLDRFNQVVRAVVLSTFLSALAQGLLTTFALWLGGFDHLMVLFLIASLVAMIPVAGTWVVWVPCVLWLVFQEKSYGWAIFITVFCTAVVGTVDNLIRTFVLNSSARLHPLLAFVSVLGGLQVMGLWGVFIGPIVAACLHALIQIFNTELKAFSSERLANAPTIVADAPAPSHGASETAPSNCSGERDVSGVVSRES